MRSRWRRRKKKKKEEDEEKKRKRRCLQEPHKDYHDQALEHLISAEQRGFKIKTDSRHVH